MDKMREEFEAWYSKELGFREDNPERMFSMFCDDGGNHEYYRLSVRCAWKSWKASRAALCVELPEVRVLDGGRIAEIGYELAVDDFERALDAAGIRYK